MEEGAKSLCTLSVKEMRNMNELCVISEALFPAQLHVFLTWSRSTNLLPQTPQIYQLTSSYNNTSSSLQNQIPFQPPAITHITSEVNTEEITKSFSNMELGNKIDETIHYFGTFDSMETSERQMSDMCSRRDPPMPEKVESKFPYLYEGPFKQSIPTAQDVKVHQQWEGGLRTRPWFSASMKSMLSRFRLVMRSCMRHSILCI